MSGDESFSKSIKFEILDISNVPTREIGGRPIIYGTAGEIDPHAFKEYNNLFYNPKFSIQMRKIPVQVVNKSRNPLPMYGSEFAAGIDLMADVPGIDRILVQPGQRTLIKTGLHVAIPDGYELQIRPRSGLALKQGISIVNSPGTIDSKLN